jgi:hypothetical protein
MQATGTVADGLPHLPGYRRGEDLAHYCRRQTWTVSNLQALLNTFAAQRDRSPEAMHEHVRTAVTHYGRALLLTLSDQEAALRRRTYVLPNPHVLERVQRYEAHLSRELGRAMQQLKDLKAGRTTPPEAAEPHPSAATPAVRPQGHGNKLHAPVDPAAAEGSTTQSPPRRPYPEIHWSTPNEDLAKALAAMQQKNCGTNPLPAASSSANRTQPAPSLPSDPETTKPRSTGGRPANRL